MYLNCHSYHSLRYGTIPITGLIQLAKENGVTQMALTDINASAGVFDFVKCCLENGIKPLVGIEFRSDQKLLYIALAKNTDGFAEICTYLSFYNLAKEKVPSCAPEFKNVFVIYTLDTAPKKLREFEFIGIRKSDLTQLIQPKWHHLIYNLHQNQLSFHN